MIVPLVACHAQTDPNISNNVRTCQGIISVRSAKLQARKSARKRYLIVYHVLLRRELVYIWRQHLSRVLQSFYSQLISTLCICRVYINIYSIIVSIRAGRFQICPSLPASQTAESRRPVESVVAPILSAIEIHCSSQFKDVLSSSQLGLRFTLSISCSQGVIFV